MSVLRGFIWRRTILAAFFLLVCNLPISLQSRSDADLSTRESALSWELKPSLASEKIGAKPVKLKVQENDEFRKILHALASDEGSSITLRLDMVGVKRFDKHYGIKVYVNTPDNDPTPPADSVYYVGVVSFFGEKETEDFSLDIAPTLRKLVANRLWTSDKPVIIRLVVASLNPKKPVGDAKVQLDRVVLELPRK